MEVKKVDLYLSLSSIPGREKHLVETLKSLVNQTIKPKLIIVNLCERYKRFNGEKYNFKYINKEKKFFKDNKNLININYCDDFGPITKLFGCLDLIKKNDNVQFITIVDDDLIYRNNMLEMIYKSIKDNSNNSYSYCVDNIDGIDIGKGADSLSINLKFLDNIRSYYEIIMSDNNLWFYHDDFIISSYLYLKNVSILNLRDIYNLRSNIYILNGNMNKRALHNLSGSKSPNELNRSLRESFNKLIKNNKLNKIKIDK